MTLLHFHDAWTDDDDDDDDDDDQEVLVGRSFFAQVGGKREGERKERAERVPLCI